MAFEATKREWGELYAFFRLLADGYVYSGTPDVRKKRSTPSSGGNGSAGRT